MSFVLVSPSTLSWFHVRAAAGRRSEWRSGGSTVASVRSDREHRRHPGVDHPDALGDAGDAGRAHGQPVGVWQGQGQRRGLGPGVGRAERLGGGLEPGVGRGE